MNLTPEQLLAKMKERSDSIKALSAAMLERLK